MLTHEQMRHRHLQEVIEGVQHKKTLADFIAAQKLKKATSASLNNGANNAKDVTMSQAQENGATNSAAPNAEQMKSITFSFRKTKEQPVPREPVTHILRFDTLDSVNLADAKVKAAINEMIEGALYKFYREAIDDNKEPVSITFDAWCNLPKSSRGSGIAAETIKSLHDAIKAWLSARGKSGNIISLFLASVKSRFKDCGGMQTQILESFKKAMGAYIADETNSANVENFADTLVMLTENLETAITESKVVPDNAMIDFD